MIWRGIVAVCLAAAAGPALAQQSAPAPHAAPAHAPAHVTPAKPAAKPTPKPTPVVQPPHNGRAEKTAPPPAAKPVTPPPPPPAEASKPAEPAKGSSTGLPLPRFVALRADEVNLRSGPGTRYPVQWVYHRRDLPVEIEREFEVWRLVKDEDGTQGWVHQATLVDRRSFVVKGKATLRSAAAEDASAVAVLQPGVIGRIRRCAAGKDWCELQVGEYRGWLPRAAFWGSYADEAVN